MAFIAVNEPAGDQSEECGHIQWRRDGHVVTLEGGHEGLGYAVTLRAFHWRIAGFQAKLPGEDAGVLGDAGRSIVCSASRLGEARGGRRTAHPPLPASCHARPSR